jgi:hypothetical protein
MKKYVTEEQLKNFADTFFKRIWHLENLEKFKFGDSVEVETIYNNSICHTFGIYKGVESIAWNTYSFGAEAHRLCFVEIGKEIKIIPEENLHPANEQNTNT